MYTTKSGMLIESAGKIPSIVCFVFLFVYDSSGATIVISPYCYTTHAQIDLPAFFPFADGPLLPKCFLSFTRCKCDYQYSGYDCSLKKCPTGDDPLTPGGVVESQAITCDASGSGRLRVFFRGVASHWMPTIATAMQVKAALEHIPELAHVHVRYTLAEGRLCQPQKNVVAITFHGNYGSLPTLTVELDETLASQEPEVIVSSKGESHRRVFLSFFLTHTHTQTNLFLTSIFFFE